ncbi:MAG: GNAT family N-acetyltransferase [Vulcanimicrobiaceae bacterium]
MIADHRGGPIVTERLRLELLEPKHAPMLLAYHLRNAGRLKPWEPARAPDFFTAAFWERSVATRCAEQTDGRAAHFLAFAGDAGGDVIADVSLTNIVRGVFQAAVMGYSVGGEYEGRGFARESVGAVVDYAFIVLGLHRVMANYRPENERSAALLRRLGFIVEGYARDYVKIDGEWRDHVLTALVNPRMID